MGMDETAPGATAPTPPPPPSAGGPTPPPPPAGGPTPAGQPQPPQPPQQGSRPQDRFFNGIRGIGLHRPQHRVVGGVCGAIAQRTGIDVTVVRVLTVVLAVFGGLGILAYGLGW